jgi:membrane-associated phospholipid phosphatase
MLIEWDQTVFEWINVGLSSSFLDYLLIPMRNKYTWIPVYVFIIAFAIFNHKIKGYYFVVFLILTVGLSDFVSNSLVKKTVQRPRPCHVLTAPKIDLKIKCGSGYSFTSNHATNHFALAMFLFLALGKSPVYKQRYLLFLWAALVAFAQVYVGVHYPIDILSGALLGSVIALIIFKLYHHFLKGFLQKYA